MSRVPDPTTRASGAACLSTTIPLFKLGPPVLLDQDRYFQVMGFLSLLRRSGRAFSEYSILCSSISWTGRITFTVWASDVWTGFQRLATVAVRGLRRYLVPHPFFVFVARRVVGFLFSFGLVWRLVGCMRGFVLPFHPLLDSLHRVHLDLLQVFRGPCPCRSLQYPRWSRLLHGLLVLLFLLEVISFGRRLQSTIGSRQRHEFLGDVSFLSPVSGFLGSGTATLDLAHVFHKNTGHHPPAIRLGFYRRAPRSLQILGTSFATGLSFT